MVQLDLLDLKENERIRTAKIYTAALISFLSFRPSLPLQFVNHEYLAKYELHMKKKEGSKTTTQIYLRCLRAIINRTIKAKLMNKMHYGFEDYSIGKTKKSKKALMPAKVEDFINYVPKNDAQLRVKDYWFMCYLTNGCNPADLLRIGWNIQNPCFILGWQQVRSLSTPICKCLVL